MTSKGQDRSTDRCSGGRRSRSAAGVRGGCCPATAITSSATTRTSASGWRRQGPQRVRGRGREHQSNRGRPARDAGTLERDLRRRRRRRHGREGRRPRRKGDRPAVRRPWSTATYTIGAGLGSPPMRIGSSRTQSRCRANRWPNPRGDAPLHRDMVQRRGGRLRRAERRRARPLPARRQRPTLAPDAHGASAAAHPCS
jgi:hypothetical protein